MKIQVLASVMYEDPNNLIERMNLTTDAIIVNQCDEDKVEDIEHKGNKIKFISSKERGVGKSRNLALAHATAEICLFADNDVVYNENYERDILEEFSKNENKDIIFFSLKEKRQRKNIKWYNCMKYGTPLTAFRLEKVMKKNITFSLLFGGGARYSAGEDSLFITQCVKSKFNLYDSGVVIGSFVDIKSTWFKGFTDKYFLDKGALYCAISKKYVYALCLQFVIRKGNMFNEEVSRIKAFKLMMRGVKSFKRDKNI